MRSHRSTKSAQPGHDPGYKRLFSHPTLVEELLRGFVEGAWLERLDFSTLERVGNSFVSDDLRERHSDLIWRLRLHGDEGRWVYLYLLLEFQSTSDPFMAVRLLTYVGLLLEEIIRREKLKPGDHLPAVLPLVLHTGRDRWRAPLRLESHFATLPKDLRRYLPRLNYLLIDERRLSLNRSELTGNRVAALMRVETNQAPTALPGLTQELDRLVPSEELELRRTIRIWFDGVVRRTFPDGILPEGVNLTEAPMLEETLIKWRDQIIRETRRDERRRAIREGQLDGMRTVLLGQLTLRFGRVPDKIRQRLEEITSMQDLKRLSRRILRAKSLSEMGLG